MAQIFGNFSDELPVSHEYLTIAFSPSSVPVKQRWGANGLSADFMADYFSILFPSHEGATNETDNPAEIKHAISFIANELLENSMKFNDESAPYPISIKIHIDNNNLVFVSTNSIHPQAVEKFQAYIKELTTSDPSELYIRHLEKNAEDESESESGLGLLTMMNDYLAKLGWKFETVQQDPEVIAVTTMVQLAV